MVIKLKDKIYEEIKEKHCRSSGKYMKSFGIITDENNLTSGTPKRNIDLMAILSNLGLIEANQETIDKINEFHDYLFKLGIEIGVSQGKKIVIDAMKHNNAVFDKLMEINPEDYTDYEFEPTFISDMKEALFNEK